jgi:8-hydroxy-5-deazaflavin:NADPH oxidoreductase
MGSRTPENLKDWAAESGSKASAGSVADAASFGDVVVLATAWSGAENALRLAGPANLRGKTVIDVTNPLKVEEGKPPGLAVGLTDSAGETVARWLPGANVVKAFNIVGNSYMVDPDFPGGPPDMFICGDDAGAKKTVADICKAFGWNVTDIGGIEGARLLEPLCLLWVRYGVATGAWAHAFKVLTK